MKKKTQHLKKWSLFIYSTSLIFLLQGCKPDAHYYDESNLTLLNTSHKTPQKRTHNKLVDGWYLLKRDDIPTNVPIQPESKILDEDLILPYTQIKGVELNCKGDSKKPTKTEEVTDALAETFKEMEKTAIRMPNCSMTMVFDEAGTERWIKETGINTNSLYGFVCNDHLVKSIRIPQQMKVGRGSLNGDEKLLTIVKDQLLAIAKQ